MKAKINNLKSLFSSKQEFHIPYYQRNYDWTEEQCEILIEDILNIADRQDNYHFIGNIVYLNNNNSDSITLVDGQQRIITLNLILLYLHKTILENDINNPHINEIFDCVYSSINKPKLFLSDEYKYAYDFICNNQFAKILVDNDYQKQNLLHNFKLIKKIIGRDSNKINKCFSGIGRLFFVDLSLEIIDDPQIIFERLNATGLQLSQADLIKNYVMMNLTIENQKILYDKYWKIIESKTIKLGRSKNKSHLTAFFSDYLTMKTGRIPNSQRIYETFTMTFINSRASFEDLSKTLDEIKMYSGYYFYLLNPAKVEEKKIEFALKNLETLTTKTFPFLLKAFHEKEIDYLEDEYFIKIIELLESYIWRRQVCNLPTNVYNDVFPKLPIGGVDASFEDEDGIVHNWVGYYYLEDLEKALLDLRGKKIFPTDEQISNALTQQDFERSFSKYKKYFNMKLGVYTSLSQNNSDILISKINAIWPYPSHIEFDDWQNIKSVYESQKDLKFIRILAISFEGFDSIVHNNSQTYITLLSELYKKHGYPFIRKFKNKLNIIENIDDVDKKHYKEFSDNFFVYIVLNSSQLFEQMILISNELDIKIYIRYVFLKN